MDAILKVDNQKIILHDFNDDYEDEDILETSVDQKVSIWTKHNDIVTASQNIILTNKIDPGCYTVAVNNDYGLFCKKTTSISDELFSFSDSISDSIIEEIDLFWKKDTIFKENNLIHKRGILLEGFPGTGKSSLITLLSQSIIDKGGVVFKVSSPNNLYDFIYFLKENFRKIEPKTPIVTIIEDIDIYENTDLLLDFLDGKNSINHHVIIGTTNNSEEIPETLLRPSRFDIRVEMPLPSEETRIEFFIFKKINKEEAIYLGKQTKECSLADLKELYISIYLLGKTKEDALYKIKNPQEKKNYKNNRHVKKIGL